MSANTLNSWPVRVVGLAVLAITCFAGGHVMGSRSAELKPSSAISLRFESTEDVFYELSWPDGFLWMIDSNRDGVLDHWRYWKKMSNGEYPTEFWTRDRNSDRRLDEWYIRTGPDEGLLEKDTDFDGVVDKVTPVEIVRKYAPREEK